MARLVDPEGILILNLAGCEIIDAKGKAIAIVDRFSAATPDGEPLGSVTLQGRLVEGGPSEVVVVVRELRDAMGTLLGRFEDASPAERGLLALVYGQLVADH
jgi:hypothetical protein